MTKLNKEGWEIKTIKEVSSFIGDGDWIESKDQSEDGIRLIQTGNIGNGVFKDKGDKAKYISDETFDALDCTEIFAGDCLISRLPDPIGRACILPNLDQRCITAVDCTILRFTEQILPKYFVYYSQSPLYVSRIISFSTGSTRKRISRKNLEGINIPLPPLPIQHHIVEELDEINAIISAKKQQLSKLDELAQSIFYNMFGDPVTNEKGWEVKKLGEIGKVKVGPFGSMLHKEDYIANGIPLVNPMHMKDFKIVVDPNFTVSKEKAEELANYLLEENDVVFARRGDIGRCVIVAKAEEGYLCGTGSLFVRFTEEIASTYIMYLVRSSSFTKELVNKAQGQTMLNLNSSIVENLNIPLPPLPLQETFAARVSAIEEEKAAIAASIDEMQTLLNARMQYWFE